METYNYIYGWNQTLKLEEYQLKGKDRYICNLYTVPWVGVHWVPKKNYKIQLAFTFIIHHCSNLFPNC